MERKRRWFAWYGMHERCYKTSHKSYQSYGGRGIIVCPAWHHFDTFLHDTGPRPPGMTLERIDNDDWYAPSNCRWATSSEQARNKRNNVRITVGGVCLTLADWSVKTGVNVYTLYERHERGWSAERIVDPRHGNSRN